MTYPIVGRRGIPYLLCVNQIMGKKSKKARALSRKGRTGVTTAEVDTAKSTITKEPSASVVSKNGESHFNLQKVYIYTDRTRN